MSYRTGYAQEAQQNIWEHGNSFTTQFLIPPNSMGLEIFGCKAKEWAQANPNLASKGINIRETASINQLVVLSNMESANSEMIKQGVSRKQRFEILHKMAKEQLKVLDTNNIEQRFRKILPDSTKKIE